MTIAGQVQHLPCNEGAHHLHGGPLGFDRQLWVGVFEGEALVFRRTSPAWEMGYPGILNVEVRYWLTATAHLQVEMLAQTDAPTPCNLAHPSYWNLAGSGTVLDHVMTSPAAFPLATDGDLLPTGEVLAVYGTACEFRAGRTIGQDFDTASLRPNTKGTAGVGHDHALVLGVADTDGMRHADSLFSPGSGLGFNFRTTAPACKSIPAVILDHI